MLPVDFKNVPIDNGHFDSRKQLLLNLEREMLEFFKDTNDVGFSLSEGGFHRQKRVHFIWDYLFVVVFRIFIELLSLLHKYSRICSQLVPSHLSECLNLRILQFI